MHEEAPRNRLCLECGAHGVAVKVTKSGLQTTIEYKCWACQHEWKMMFPLAPSTVALPKTA
jgi:hypothetical protein